ncbi:type VI secretion system-associated protein TagO [Rhizobium alvei]|uniref:Type VI secretion system-associated protein TagO n=1 Tax=Rhizobium alvei TaxID=1132659 RepID=A0ABT8YU13_9HYPH|nr:type VI secretion system-associated protein TagO [Rhizobium alvei]MDO6966995.1 type VI secretion system-associated protein TagO [Rhizobium alvei]
MRFAAIFVFIGSVCAGSAVAQPSDCAKVEHDLDRLSCYDKQSGRTPTVEVVTPAQSTKWVVQNEVSKLTDKKLVFMSVESEDIVTCSFGRQSKVFLNLRCADNRTSVMVSSECQMVSNIPGYGTVDYRIDQHPARSVEMDQSTDSRALGLWSGSSAIPFIKQALGGKKFIVKFTPFGSSPVTAEFDITGIDDAIKPLREECKW